MIGGHISFLCIICEVCVEAPPLLGGQEVNKRVRKKGKKGNFYASGARVGEVAVSMVCSSTVSNISFDISYQSNSNLMCQSSMSFFFISPMVCLLFSLSYRAGIGGYSERNYHLS